MPVRSTCPHGQAFDRSGPVAPVAGYAWQDVEGQENAWEAPPSLVLAVEKNDLCPCEARLVLKPHPTAPDYFTDAFLKSPRYNRVLVVGAIADCKAEARRITSEK